MYGSCTTLIRMSKQAAQLVVRASQSLADDVDDLVPYVEWIHRGRSVGRGRSVAAREALIEGVALLRRMRARDEQTGHWPPGDKT